MPLRGWLLGSSDFVDKIRQGVGQAGHPQLNYLRLAGSQPLTLLSRILSAVAWPLRGRSADIWQPSRKKSISRDVAAWLAQQLTSCTLRDLAGGVWPRAP